MRFAAALLVTTLAYAASPVDFGVAELNRALVDRRARVRVRWELNQDPPETFRIQGNRITGGDLRGLMYGLLEAAEQIRRTGRLRPTRGVPAVAIRGIRLFVDNEDLDKSWYYSEEFWRAYFQMLARDRFNRFNLVFAHQTNYLAPPYPFWVEVDQFPQIQAGGLSTQQRDRNLQMLRFISQTANDYGIDFTLGIWEHNIPPGMTPTVTGLTPDNIGPYSYAALKKVLAACPAIRSVQVRTNAESGIPRDQQVKFYRDWVFRAIREAGRRVTLDLRGWAMDPGMLEAAENAGIPLRVSSKYWCEDLGRPYQPAETWPAYSYLNLLEKPRPYEFFWELWGLGSHRLLLWGDPDYVRRAVPTLTLAGSSGFEIDPPLAQKGFGNRPGEWSIFPGLNRWEFERYWFFYLLWGRLTYDPKTPERVWMAEFERRFGSAGRDVYDAYRAASKVLNEIVAAHLADPNMYLWPEVNPGGLIDAYKDVLPSEWRFIASISEAVHNRIHGVTSAKQTPLETAEILDAAALDAEQALDRAKSKTGADNKEWLATESDLRALAALARYHARKQMAADHLTYFYETGDPTGLHAAKRELGGALSIWKGLVKLTDGVYPDQMAFGPDDVGHWKDRLPYVEHDVATLEEREKVFDRFGRFDFGFDFGGAVEAPRPLSIHHDPYVVRNTVEPRFQPVDPATKYDEKAGYGWITDGPRTANELPLTPYAEIRSFAPNPSHLPQNVLFGDSIRGRGAQTFRVRTGDGQFVVQFLHPDLSVATKTLGAQNGVLDIVFPEGEWTVSGLAITRAGKKDAEPPPERWPVRPPRPTIVHTPPQAARPDQPLKLTLRINPARDVRVVRLYYRPLNTLEEFRMMEAAGPNPTFTIPAGELSPQWDLLYYFEILNQENSGWFEPDPHVATPYYILKVETPPPAGASKP